MSGGGLLSRSFSLLRRRSSSIFAEGPKRLGNEHSRVLELPFSKGFRRFSRGSRVITAAGAASAAAVAISSSILYFSGATSFQNAAEAAAGNEDSDGVYSFGSAQYNQLGLGDGKNRATPTRVEALDVEEVVKIAAGLYASMAVTSDGAVYTWGRGANACQQHLSRLNSLFLFFPLRCYLCSFSGHSDNKYRKRVYTWGAGEALGREGNGKSPGLVSALEGKQVESVSCGPTHMLAVTKQGELYAWGSKYEGALGLGSRERTGDYAGDETDLQDDNYYVQTPTLVGTLADVVDAKCGNSFSLALTKDGKLYSFGAGDYGQTGLGGGSSSDRYTRTPTQIKAFGPTQKIVKIDAGLYHSAAITEDGKVFTWGYGKDGQCGHGDRVVHTPIPQQVRRMSKNQAIEVSCGDGHTAVLCRDGELYVFGRGRDGQLGRGDQLESVASYRTEPLPIEFFTRHNLRVGQVALGGYHSLVLTNSKRR
eukprot:jgi/Bigna1/85156/estExt_fgenesh1_pg.C_20322